MDELRHPLCFLRGIWYTLRYGFTEGVWLSGHDFEEQSTTGDVQTLKCKTCGYESLGEAS